MQAWGKNGLAARGWSVPEIRRLGFGEQREVSISELANHPGVARFRLRDGRLAAKAVYKHSHSHLGNEVRSIYDHAVVPVLPRYAIKDP